MQQTLTPYQSLYYAWLLTRRAAGDSVESLASTLVDSQVDLNPHQVEAALFACANPLSRGVILADEVGLGKDAREDEVAIRLCPFALSLSKCPRRPSTGPARTDSSQTPGAVMGPGCSQALS